VSKKFNTLYLEGIWGTERTYQLHGEVCGRKTITKPVTKTPCKQTLIKKRKLRFTFLGTISADATILNKNSLKNGHPGSNSFTGSEERRERYVGGKILKAPQNRIGKVCIS
jgi:hypothetical protein